MSLDAEMNVPALLFTTILALVMGMSTDSLAATNELTDGLLDPIDRQVLVVLDPRLAPPHAVDLVRRDTTREGVAEFLAALDGIEKITKVLNAPEGADIAQLRLEDPLSPEVLLNEYLVITLRNGVDVDVFLETIRMNRWVLSAERNTRFGGPVRFSVCEAV
jgi:hypothetical protein